MLRKKAVALAASDVRAWNLMSSDFRRPPVTVLSGTSGCFWMLMLDEEPPLSVSLSGFLSGTSGGFRPQKLCVNIYLNVLSGLFQVIFHCYLSLCNVEAGKQGKAKSSVMCWCQ